MAADNRKRNFATVVYPESAPDNWRSILSGLFIPCFISPLHDQDNNPTGEPKKPHFHVMLMFEGKKTNEQVKELCETFGGVGLECVNSLRGYARYLCHLDNPEKHQYVASDVMAFGGADYSSTIGLVTDKYKCIREMIVFCKAHGVYSYSDLLLYSSEERDDWFRTLCDCGTLVMKEYLKSLSWTSGKPKVNSDTGEVEALNGV